MRNSTNLAAGAFTLLAAALFLGSPAAARADAADTKASPAPGDSAAYEKFLTGAERKVGIFPVIVKDGKVYLELTADQLDKEFYEHATSANGLGGYGVLSGDDFFQDARIITFHRVNEKQVAVIWPPEAFLAPAGSALENAVRASTANSVQGVATIAAEDKAAKKMLIDTAFLLGDQLHLGDQLSKSFEDTANPFNGYRLDPDRTYYGTAKAFPENDIIEVDQTFESTRPDVVDTVTDPHTIQFRIKYNFAKVLSSPEYMPRLADDRVGYWMAAHVAFDDDRKLDDVVRYLTRWNLRASDPSKPSPAVKPLVYTLTNTIPEQYRKPIKDAILEWNKAFAKIGILDAVRVQDQPADPNFDPDDIRYNPIRWLTEANDGGFAEAQIEWDPRTGEIFRSGVLIDADIVRDGNIEYDTLVGPSSAYDPDPAAPLSGRELASDPDLWDPAKLTVRDASLAASHRQTKGFLHRDDQAHAQFAFGALAMELQGETIPDSYRYDFLKSIVLHEVGHDFGLAHNFLGHNAATAAELRDAAYTDANGVGSSVMEYSPTNVWPKGLSHGDYFATTIGSYDYHVIHWGYAPIPGAATPEAERPVLAQWASAASDPRYAFASDEDVEYDGHAVDPRIAQYMLTDKPIDWCETQLGLDRSLLRGLDSRFPAAQAPWDDERLALMFTSYFYTRCAGSMTHYIAGEHLSRSRVGDPHAPNPLTAVSRDEERRAYRDLDRYLFADGAWPISPATLSRTVYSEYETFGNFGVVYAPRHDVSYAQLIGAYQNRALAYMFSPLVLSRLVDLPSKYRADSTMSLADLFTWTQSSIYGDLHANVPKTVVRRNLQRSYAKLLALLAVRPPAGTPLDAQALARHELAALSADLRRTLAMPNLDVQTRAHYEALQADVARALDAHGAPAT